MNPDYLLESYRYDLPEEAIARYPSQRRDESRLLVLDRNTGRRAHRRFSDLPKLLRPGDCLVVNDSKVFPARLVGRKPTGGRLEIFLLNWPQEQGGGMAEVDVIYKASKPLRQGQAFSFKATEGLGLGQELGVEVLTDGVGGRSKVRLSWDATRWRLKEVLEAVGRVPLPPYLGREDQALDRERYQTVYAEKEGSVAAPTAGLHFSRGLIQRIEAMGVRLAHVTLHVGYGTFAPVRTRDIRDHKIHSEWISVPAETAELVNETRAEGGRIIAVGTTSVRSLEFAADDRGILHPYTGQCDLYIFPGYEFKLIDGMITNFHLPESSLLMLVAAFVGREIILEAYREAVVLGYRFYSYGDAMFIQ